ncbi:hypothetical protein LSCM1_02794 [Leishmania martiniquensis]|uniref:Uncharacterized protein n=1 Tax=Leishmania martiniquensis TaxID=1580590 RepID=A0A836GCF8_9TRYP|nr:hypothetical protein LSCM1_02794 [Leishmania martiniquensis]
MGSVYSIFRCVGASPLALHRPSTSSAEGKEVNLCHASEVSEKTLFCNPSPFHRVSTSSGARELSNPSSSLPLSVWMTPPLGHLLLFSGVSTNRKTAPRQGSWRRRATAHVHSVSDPRGRDRSVDFSAQTYQTFFELAVDERRIKFWQQKRLC